MPKLTTLVGYDFNVIEAPPSVVTGGEAGKTIQFIEKDTGNVISYTLADKNSKVMATLLLGGKGIEIPNAEVVRDIAEAALGRNA